MHIVNEDPRADDIESRRPGMDPLVDIARFGHAVFSPSVDGLIREILMLGSPAEMPDLWRYLTWDRSDDVYAVDEHLDINALELELTEVRDRLEEEGRASGWEVDRLLEQARQRPGA